MIDDEAQVVLAVLDRFRDKLWSKDTSMVDEFSGQPDDMLIGSDHDEIAKGPVSILSLLSGLFASPNRYRWEWHDRHASVLGDVAWLFANGELVVVSGAETTRTPYRITGVLQFSSGGWKWRQFHGSQP